MLFIKFAENFKQLSFASIIGINYLGGTYLHGTIGHVTLWDLKKQTELVLLKALKLVASSDLALSRLLSSLAFGMEIVAKSIDDIS